VNSRWTSLAPVLLAGVLAGCTKDKPALPKGSPPPVEGSAADQSQQDAEFLGRQAFEVLDLVMSYASSHQGRNPASLRQIGADSLTPATIRRLSHSGSSPLVTVLYRRPGGRRLRSCSATSDVLEEAALKSGRFTVQCAEQDGGQTTFTVGGKRRAN
jgi:hypothetical protein